MTKENYENVNSKWRVSEILIMKQIEILILIEDIRMCLD